MPNVKRISPVEAKALLDEGYTYLDVRSEPEFAAGHPTGAVNVPLMHAGPAGMTPNPDFLDVVTRAFGKDAKLVVGCQAGGRSLRAAEALVAAGFGSLVDQRAGFGGSGGAFGGAGEPGWRACGLPVTTGAPAGASYADVKAKASR